LTGRPVRIAPPRRGKGSPRCFSSAARCASSASSISAAIVARRGVEVSRHKSVDTLRGYVRRAELFKDHAGGAFL
jgi:hypothetical protein